MESPPRRKSRIRQLLGILFVVAAFGFLGAFVGRDLDQLRDFRWEIRPLLLIGSILLNIFGLLWGVAAWKLLLGLLGYPISLAALARVWFISGLGRYIPGKIWQFVGAAHLGAGSGIPAAVTVTSLAAHTFFFFIGALLVGAYLSPIAALGLDADLLLALRVLAPFLLFLVHPVVIRRVLSLIGRLSGREVGEWRGTWSGAVAVVLLGTVAWAITGLSLFLFIRSLVTIETSAAAMLIGINGLAFVAGYLVFIAPAGLGAKEGALAALLSLYLPVSVAAVIAVAARLWTVVAEVLPALALLRLRATSPAASGSTAPPGP